MGVSFLPHNVDNKAYPYYPQFLVSEEVYVDYISHLSPIDIENIDAGIFEIADEECSQGICPIK